jgi:TrmH family RNA methyltransferase
MKIKRNNVHFILVEPKHPGNIGSAARALKTMGFSNLVLINPGEFDIPEARWMAHASEDIFDGIVVKQSLQDILGKMSFVVATTQRNRGYHLPFFTPDELARKLIPISQNNQVALVFGREDTGLKNKELCDCHVISTIPASNKHPSLNLSQAVMIYCYELYYQSWDSDKKYHWNHASYQEINGVFEHLEMSLKNVEFVPKDNWSNFLMRFQRLFSRAFPEKRDVKLMHKILQAFDEYIDKPKGNFE